MTTYEYECEKCGLRFKKRQAMAETPLTECPECQGHVHRIVSGGVGFILKGTDNGLASHHGSGCSLEQTGRTCCGKAERCGKPACDE